MWKPEPLAGLVEAAGTRLHLPGSSLPRLLFLSSRPILSLSRGTVNPDGNWGSAAGAVVESREDPAVHLSNKGFP